MSRAETKAAFDVLWRVLGDAGLSHAATFTITPDLVAVSPTVDATADDAMDVLTVLTSAFTVGPTFGGAGRIALGQVDGAHVIVIGAGRVEVLS